MDPDSADLILDQPVACPGEIVATESVYEITPSGLEYLADCGAA